MQRSRGGGGGLLASASALLCSGAGLYRVISACRRRAVGEVRVRTAGTRVRRPA